MKSSNLVSTLALLGVVSLASPLIGKERRQDSRSDAAAWPYVDGAPLSVARPSVDLVGDPTHGRRQQRGSAVLEPIPAPTMPTLDSTSGWWGSKVRYTADYLDPIPKGNTTLMFDLPVRASNTSGGQDYATWAEFEVPDDSRAFWAGIQAHGRSSSLVGSPFYYLHPPGIGPFPSIRGVVYAPQTGMIWVAANGIVQENDIFKRVPTVGRQITSATIPGLNKPCISRATQDGRILIVDGALGVEQVYQISVSGGGPTRYASTKDSSFTRNIQPVGIAVDPDGSVCCIADGSTGKVVMIPFDAGSGSTIKDGWGGASFSFPDPCGIDVHVGHQVVVASNDGWTHILLGENSSHPYHNVGPDVYSIEIDDDSSELGYIRYIHSWNLGYAEAFNMNPVGDSERYHGAAIIGLDDGRLSVEPDWTFIVGHHYFQRVVLNNSEQSAPYPSAYQVKDRVIQLDVNGWYGVPLQLRVIDPPDLSPYAPEGGWQNAAAVPPYEGNDNRGSSDYGLSNSSNGPWATTLMLRPGVDNIPVDQTNRLRFYLKVPDRYSGDNFQVEVTKCRPDGTVLPQRVAGLSAVYTSWKRMFVEQDKMFRKGGVLYQWYGAPGQCGGEGQPPCCGTGTEPPCNQVIVYDWKDGQNAKRGDRVVVFDRTNTAEGGGETRTVTATGRGPEDGTRRLTLDSPLTKSYIASLPAPATTPRQPDFSNHESAGIGVVNGGFYEADMAQIELALNDGYVEVIQPSSGGGAVPYVSPKWFNHAINFGREPEPILDFNQTWFFNFRKAQTGEPVPARPDLPMPRNYMHLLAASLHGQRPMMIVGWAFAKYDASFVFRGTIEWYAKREKLSPSQITNWCQRTTVHELCGHQFDTNRCSPGLGWHDQRDAWCEGTFGPCPGASASPKHCVMYYDDAVAQRTDGVSRFCLEDLLYGDPNAPCQDLDGNQVEKENSAVRTHQDPM